MTNLKFISNIIEILPYKEKMWELLCLCDKDFYPPLSTRENNPLGPTKYFEGLFNDKSKFILAFSEERLVGFSIFYHNYYEDVIAQYTPCNYVKVACVHPDFRGQKIASRFNRFIEQELPFELTLPISLR